MRLVLPRVTRLFSTVAGKYLWLTNWRDRVKVTAGSTQAEMVARREERL